MLNCELVASAGLPQYETIHSPAELVTESRPFLAASQQQEFGGHLKEFCVFTHRYCARKLFDGNTGRWIDEVRKPASGDVEPTFAGA